MAILAVMRIQLRVGDSSEIHLSGETDRSGIHWGIFADGLPNDANRPSPSTSTGPEACAFLIPVLSVGQGEKDTRMWEQAGNTHATGRRTKSTIRVYSSQSRVCCVAGSWLAAFGRPGIPSLLKIAASRSFW